MQHAGSIVAPDERFAEIYAREQYGRRGESDALWLVPREAVNEIGSSSTSSTSSTVAWTAIRSRKATEGGT
jgi:1,2-phenylacetyl-CoA epoxidase PaaB subunit